MSDMNVYQENGYADRNEYLAGLAEDYDIDKAIVDELASVLGPSEDFDGLVTTIEDYSEQF